MTIRIEVQGFPFDLEDKDTALILAIQELTIEIRRIANNG